ncbi:hypothetical protein TNIN_290231 [Trichonephila inaurata madagascariensis]|uniref:Uncharacterized protein n=1 Tax=Trichonephila inaurata madagascariensis TaxID=2747483 RepID=A0A8X6XFW2_9ARAC|nr:hypothetical protein TNIN_290231 [Trichonephila inaurata madagascariensis]
MTGERGKKPGIREWIPRFGVPGLITTDQGRAGFFHLSKEFLRGRNCKIKNHAVPPPLSMDSWKRTRALKTALMAPLHSPVGPSPSFFFSLAYALSLRRKFKATL